VDEGVGFAAADVASSAELDCEHCEDGDLGGESLCACNADFRSDVEVYSGVGGPGDRGADDVDDSEDGCSSFLGLLDRGKGIGGFAGLAYCDDDGLVFDDGVAIAEFAGVFGFGGDAGQLLEEEFSDEACVEGSSAGGHNEAFCPGQLAEVRGDASELDLVVLAVDSSAHTGCQGVGLLEDFFEHVVLETAKLDLFEREFDFLEVFCDGDVGDGLCVECFGSDDDHFVVGEVYCLRGVLDDCGCVGGEDVFVAADAENQWAAFFCTDEGVGEIAAEYSQAVGSVQLAEGALDGPFEFVASGFFVLAGVEPADEVCDDFGIGFAGEGDAFVLEPGLQSGVVFDDSVVNDGDSAGVVEVGMCVGGIWLAVCGPACVADAEAVGLGWRVEDFLECADSAFGLFDFYCAAAQ